MGRLPGRDRDQLTPDGQALYDSIVSGRGAQLVDRDGSLAGPFNAFVRVPGTGQPLSRLGEHLRFHTTIDRRLSEVAIITVGARWRAEFEWWAHAAMARRHGVPDAVVDAIGRGEDPPFTAEDERAIHTVASQLARTGQITDAAYQNAQALLGDQGMVELISLCGYYTLISFLLNGLRVPLPDGAAPMWPDGD